MISIFTTAEAGSGIIGPCLLGQSAATPSGYPVKVRSEATDILGTSFGCPLTRSAHFWAPCVTSTRLGENALQRCLLLSLSSDGESRLPVAQEIGELGALLEVDRV